MRALLLKPDLSYKEVAVKDFMDTRKLVGGNIEMVPIRDRLYFKNKFLIAYVNEDGLMTGKSYNQWGVILDEIGFYVDHMYGLSGDIVLLLSDEQGYDKGITNEVIRMIESVKARAADD